MGIDFRTVLLVTIFTVAIVFLNQEFKYTGYATAEPLLEINLDKGTYLGGEKLGGIVNITFKGNVDANTEIKTTFGGKIQAVKLTDYLNQTNTAYKATQETTMISNGAAKKSLTLKKSEETTIGIKLPAMATVDSVSMNIQALAGTQPTSLSLDIPEESGKPEWKYLGEVQGYKSIPVYPKGLNIEKEDSIQYLDSNTTYYCQKTSLPYSRDFMVSAKYRKVAGSTAALSAYIFSFDGSLAYGGLERCSMPAGTAELAWQGCNISIEKGIQGDYLLCLGIDKEEKAYEIARDGSTTTTKYNCQELDWGVYECASVPSRNYFIAAYPGRYAESFTGTISNQEFGYWATDNTLESSLTSSLEECSEDELGDCTILLKVKSESDSSIEFSNLRIEYTEPMGGSSYTDQLYDISTTKPEIYEIGNATMTKAVFAIPVYYFNISMPNVTKSEEMELKVSIAGSEDTAVVKIYSTMTPEELTGVEADVSEAEQKINELKTKEFAWLLDLEPKTQQLENYRNELAEIKNSNATREEKEEQTKAAEQGITQFINTLPDSSAEVSKYRDKVSVEPLDMENIEAEDKAAIYEVQGDVDVDTTITTYRITKKDGSTDVYSIVKKEIRAKKELKDVSLYEIIPKEVAATTADIKFQNTNYEVIKEDPIVKYFYSTLNSATITYAVEALITQQSLYQIKTITVPKKIEREQQTPGYTCGDKVCSSPEEDETVCPEDCEKKRGTPWLWIGIAAIALVAGILYINFYKGRFSLGKVLGKSPFKTEQDLENVKSYIKGQLEKKVKKSEISKMLLQKGWTEKQIEYAFESIKWDKKKENAMEKAPKEIGGANKLTNYIKTCQKLGITTEKIRQSLKAKGWKDEQVNEGFQKAAELNPSKMEIKKEKPKPFFEQKGL